MKKILCILSFTSFLYNTHSQAQSFSIKPEIGANLNSLHHSDDIQTLKNNMTGLKAGVALNLKIGNNLFLEPGVFFDMKNAKFNQSDNGLVFERDFSLQYLTIPVNFLGQLPIGIGKIFVSAGPYIGLGLSGTQDFTVNGISTTFEEEVFGKNEHQLSQYDFGANIGVGYITPIGLYGRVQYGWGFNNLSNINQQQINLRSWQISLGWSIDFF